MIEGLEKSSFRDPDGFVFYHNKAVYRAIRPSYKSTWNHLTTQPFFKELISSGKLPAFEEVLATGLLPDASAMYKVLKVEEIPFISYPSEWSFEQLKKAALLTLQIQKKALESNLTLKDASAYNVQFTGSKAVFIDLFSFDMYTEGKPWAAYGQFCRHFLGPLLLSAYGLRDLQSLFVTHIDGLPLSMVAKLLPWSTRFNVLTYTHIHLHARFENKHAGDKEISSAGLRISKARSRALIEHLEQGIKKLKLQQKATNWTDYYDTCSYNEAGLASKKAFVEKHLAALAGKLCVDLGANTGEFSELAAGYFNRVLACDSDAEVVRFIQKKKLEKVLALRIDLANPTPAYGWNGSERKSFLERAAGADLVLALALVHHLCIGNNVPLEQLASFFAGFARQLVIEFVPKTDPQVKKLLVTRQDIFEDYTSDNFRKEFDRYYTIADEQAVPGSERVMFLLKRNR
jgi:hypothetical protein